MVAVTRCGAWLGLLAALAGCAAAAPDGAKASFADAAELARFEFTDAAAFRWNADDGHGCLELHAPSAYQPPHRSPLALALLRDAEFGDFDLRVRLRQTGREYPHRDLVVVFAWRDASHFAYAHLASQADANAHHVMLVDGADRRPATVARSPGVAWGEVWHEVRLRRCGTDVQVYFDGAGPVLVGEVPAWPGRVGVGSFDDTGRFDDLVVSRDPGR